MNLNEEITIPKSLLQSAISLIARGIAEHAYDNIVASPAYALRVMVALENFMLPSEDTENR